MKIQIEIIVFAAIFLTFIFWALWFNITNKFYKWRYTNERDKGRRQEERGRVEPVEDASLDIPRPSQPEERGILQTSEPFTSGKNSSSNRKTFLGRFRRRKTI